MSTHTICVAVCTRDRTVQLERLLNSLDTQKFKPSQILVVDNAPSTDATYQLIVARNDQSVRYVCEAVGGLDFARNKALEEADTDIVAFIDDDAVADIGWLAAIDSAFSYNGHIALCTGKVEALFLQAEGQRLFEANGGFDKGSTRIMVPDDEPQQNILKKRPMIAWTFGLGVGCNLAVRRNTALELGGFDEALDMGAVMPGGGDTDMIWRILEAGHGVMYEPKALVSHEHRATVAGAIDQIVGHNKASMAMLAKAWRNSSVIDRLPIALFVAWRLIKPGIRLIRRSVGRDPLPTPVLLRIWWNCLVGIFIYPRACKLAIARKRSVNATNVAAKT